jgi:hypothetical protein
MGEVRSHYATNGATNGAKILQIAEICQKRRSTPLLGAPSPRPIRLEDTYKREEGMILDGNRGGPGGNMINASTSILRCIINRVNSAYRVKGNSAHASCNIPCALSSRAFSYREK